MSKRVLVIGVGGSGKTSLTILKERLEETYGQVPDNVVLLTLDTDELRDLDAFAGTQLTAAYDDRGREPEFRSVTSKPGVTMNTIFADIASGRTVAYMRWLERDKLDRILGPAERDIRGGAQQRRPVGRVAVFQRWDNPIHSAITDAIARMYGEAEDEQPVDAIARERSKRQIFIVGSVAGGTGSGFMVDVANLVRHAVQSNNEWQSVDVSAIIVLPDAFSSYTTRMNDPSNLKPNSYAALRELDRFMRTHSADLPYMIRYDEDLRSITWNTGQPLDHVYLVDTASPSAVGDANLGGDPVKGVFPIIADFIMAHVDQSLGDALASLRSNAGLHYNKEEGWQYSSFNVMTYLFPVDDVIESFSYRFVRELLTREFLPLVDKTKTAQVQLEATKETERIFLQTSVNGKVNPSIIQKAIAATRRVDPETPDASWGGLFNLISLSETGFAEDYADLNGWLDYIRTGMAPSKEGEYKHESYDEGYRRLLNFAENARDECLGPQIDPDDEEARSGGQWDRILSRYREALRLRFTEVLDAALLDTLNRRDSESTLLLPARLPMARGTTATLKQVLGQFKLLLQQQYGALEVDRRLRKTNEDLRNAISWMQQTKDARRVLIGKSDARKAQDSYIALFQQKMNLALHQRVHRTVTDLLDALGAAETDQDKLPSVVYQADLELENWQATLQEVDRLLARWASEHDKNREEKRSLRKVRHYLTDDKFEEQLYQQPEHAQRARLRVLGQVRGEKGLTWQRVEPTQPLDYRMVTAWTEEANGPDEIARRFFAGVKDIFQVVRGNVTVAERVAVAFKSPASFVNTVGQVNEPFLRYNPATNAKVMAHERYVSFNLSRASDEARRFLEQARTTLRDQGLTVDIGAESLVACTVVEVARGVRLSAVDQFVACETGYRTKLYQGREGLHLFPEEQVATSYENRIESLGESNNRLRALSPELVVAMGDDNLLRAFTLACAYGLIREGRFKDPATGAQSTEVGLYLDPEDEQGLKLSNSRLVRALDHSFLNVTATEQIARLYLSALQNFALLATQKPGVPSPMVPTLIEALKRQGVPMDYIDNPFTLTALQLNERINMAIEKLGPTAGQEKDVQRREAINCRRRVDKHLQPFLRTKVEGCFKVSPVARVRDMGTVMHLVLQPEINELRQRSAGVQG